jgi:hypothetical protein
MSSKALTEPAEPAARSMEDDAEKMPNNRLHFSRAVSLVRCDIGGALAGGCPSGSRVGPSRQVAVM